MALINGGSANDFLEGSGGNDTLRGAAGNDWLVASAGDDVLIGGSGFDTVSFSTSTHAVTVRLQDDGAGVALGEGHDLLQEIEALRGSDFDDLLAGNSQADELWGAGGNDLLLGYGGDDLLFGQGADTLIGGLGNDTYFVDDEYSSVVEQAEDHGPDGGDWVSSSARRYTLPEHVERGTIARPDGAMYGNALDNRIAAGLGNNVISGGGGVDTLDYGGSPAAVRVDLSLSGAQDTGGSGVDTVRLFENLIGTDYADQLRGNALWNRLDGGRGNDTLTGGDGSDTYLVRDWGDVVIETNADRASGGSDWVWSHLATYTLPEHVENGALIDNYLVPKSKLFGNGLDNLLVANERDNRMGGGGGTDTISYAGHTQGVHVNLALTVEQYTEGSGFDTLFGFENLSGSAHADRLQGDARGNVINGGAGADWIRGGLGNDLLYGSDDLHGDGEVDRFVFDTAPNGSFNYDRIFGFEADGTDKILLDAAVFAAIGGVLSGGELRLGSVARDADDHILFDAITGNLFYDFDGSGAGAKVLFAKLINWSGSIDASDFAMLPPMGG